MIPPTILTEDDAKRAQFVICDRGSKRSRMQIFTVGGTFVRYIEIPYIDIVSGLSTTQDRKIIVVDSVRSSVSILNEYGQTLRWFMCGNGINEPSDIIAHKDLFYICDFKVCFFSFFRSQLILSLPHFRATLWPSTISMVVLCAVWPVP